MLGFTGRPPSPVPGGAMGVHAVRVEEAVFKLAFPGASLEVVHLEPRGPWEGGCVRNQASRGWVIPGR